MNLVLSQFPQAHLAKARTVADSDHEELDRFIVEIEDAADKEYEVEEEKEKRRVWQN